MTSSERVNVGEFPVIDLQAYIKDRSDPTNQCQVVADCLKKYGIVVLKDSRATEEDNSKFLDMMERYYEQSDFTTDARPAYMYQVGVTPELKERARNHCARAEGLRPEDRPTTLCPPELDKKSRFFWRVGDRPEHTKFEELNAEPVIPQEFPEWEEIMNMWGNKMLDALHELVEMSAIGLGLEKYAFREIMKFGPHLLAPTGSNFYKYGQLNSVLAGYHYDLNLLTIHGKSRFPGLYIWLRDGRKVRVQIPDGCLLVQAGKQMEYLTGGEVEAGFHEVVVSDATLETIDKRRELKKSLWRVSSTLFSHSASDKLLQPLGKYATSEALQRYPPKLAGDQVRDELAQVNLSSDA